VLPNIRQVLVPEHTDLVVVNGSEGQNIQELSGSFISVPLEAGYKDTYLPDTPSNGLSGPVGQHAQLLGGMDNFLPARLNILRKVGEVGWGIDVEARHGQLV
jgi:hypothetical protein